MNKLAWILALLMIGCASVETPAWRQTSFIFLESYKTGMLTGKKELAELQFQRALEEINKSGNLEILARAHLTRQAIYIALLGKKATDDYLAVERLHPNEINRNYYLFLQGSFPLVHSALLPPQYQKLLPALQKNDSQAVADAMTQIEDPLSRLIAAGLAVRAGLADERLLLAAIDTASTWGWKEALLVYLTAAKSHYEKGGEKDKARRMQDIFDLITKERPPVKN